MLREIWNCSHMFVDNPCHKSLVDIAASREAGQARRHFTHLIITIIAEKNMLLRCLT
jgi:hypothetical protein